MKKILLILVMTTVFSLSAKHLNVLMIGNSFSLCVGSYLPQMVKSVPGESITLTSAYIGGCSLELHWKNIAAAEKNPKLRQYMITVWNSKTGKKTVDYKPALVLLKTQKYDIITIQQSSMNSIDYATYQPYAKNLIATIRKYQPQAEIVVQQTWSYRADSGFLEKKKMTNDDMYQKLENAYQQLASENGFRIIPTGYAIQISRKNAPLKFRKYDMNLLKTLSWPDLPPQAGDVVGKLYWAKNRKTGLMMISQDPNHLNIRGEYLQAAVWFAFLYEKNTSEIKFVPETIGNDDAEFLKKCAQEAIDQYRKTEK